MVSGPRVLQVTDHLRAGGAERMVVSLVAELTACDLARTVVCTAGDELDADELGAIVRETADRHVVLHRRRLVDLRIASDLVRQGRRHRAQLVHSHPGTTNLHAELAARVLGVPHVISLHTMPGPLIEDSWARQHADAWSARGRAVIVAPAQAIADAYGRRWRVPSGRLRVIPNAAAVRTGPPPARRPLGVPADGRLIVSAARLQPAKGFEDLIAAAERLLPSRPDLRIAIAGDGPERERLQERIRASGLAERILLLGHRTDVSDLLATADGFCLPSHHEGLPLSLLEAMGAGLACVSTAVGGVPDAVADGVDGLLVPPHDPAALAAALARIADDPDLGRRLGAAASATVAREHTTVVAARRYGALYRQLVDRAA